MKYTSFSDRLIFVLAIVLYLAALGVFGYWNYHHDKHEIMNRIDKELYNYASTLKYVLPGDYHDRAVDKTAISVREDRHIADKLTRLVRTTGLKYAYTIIKKEDKLFFVASDITADPETERGTFYFFPYDEADPVFNQAFEKETPSYKTVSDQWGTVRTVMVRERSPGGTFYLACADHDIGYIKSELQNNLIRSMMIILILLILGLPIIITYIRLRTRYLDTIEESENKYRNLVESTEDLVWTINNQGVHTYSNHAVKRFLGYSVDEVTGKSAFPVMYPDDAARWEEKLKACIAAKTGWKNEIIRWLNKEGDTRIFESTAAPILDKSGDVIGFQGLDRDITERISAQEALKESEEKYRIIVENQTDLVVKVDLEGRFLFVSPSYCKMFGRQEKELLGNLFMPLVHEEDKGKTYRAMEKMLQPPHSAYIEHRAMTNQGWRWFGWMGSVVLDSVGEVIEIIGVGRDITANKIAEADKIKAQRIAAEHESYAFVGKISGALAHDFNNILGAIMGRTELALLKCNDPELEKSLSIIMDQTYRGRNLTKNLVAFAKDMEPKQEYFKINEKINLLLDLMRKDLSSVAVNQDIGPNIPDFLGDPGMIEHALMNLIQNSIHAVSLSSDPRIAIRSRVCGQDLCIEIEDNGCGIPDEHLEEIFNPTFSLKGSKDLTQSYDTKIKGTGYGLANVKKNIDLHNGSIQVSSKVGMGTKFLIRLPITKKELDQEEILEIEEELFETGKSILLVEDETAISEIQYSILTHPPCSHQVDIAISGDAAIDLFNRNPYDLISLDYQLPGKLNGLDVYEYIRKTNKTVPILFVSGNIEFIESIKSLKENDTLMDHISKPCQNRDYIKAVNRLLVR